MSLNRTSLALTPAMKANLEALARIQGTSQTGIIDRALRSYMKKNGLEPDRYPEVEFKIVYEDSK